MGIMWRLASRCAVLGIAAAGVNKFADVELESKNDIMSELKKAHISPSLNITGSASKPVVVGIASRALFSLEEEHSVFEAKGLKEYNEVQIGREDKELAPGTAFPFIKAMNRVNSALKELNGDEKELFKVVLISHNHAQVGIRLINSIQHHCLDIKRMCLTGSSDPVQYLKAYDVMLYLSAFEEDVENALKEGIAAAHISIQNVHNPVEDQLRVAFDLDDVLFSGESEAIYKNKGLDAFQDNEKKHKDEPCNEGRLKRYAEALGRMQKKLKNSGKYGKLDCPIRIYIVTSRSADEAGYRAIKTLRHWGLEVDETHFMDGAAKGPILEVIRPHIFFDDQAKHIKSAQKYGVPAGYVKHG